MQLTVLFWNQALNTLKILKDSKIDNYFIVGTCGDGRDGLLWIRGIGHRLVMSQSAFGASSFS